MSEEKEEEEESYTSKQWKEKGNAAFKECEWQESVDAYTKAIELDQDNHMLYSNRSAAYFKLGDYPNSLGDSEMCIALKPDFYKGYGRRGTALHAMHRYDDAIAAYQQGIAACPDEEHLKMGLAAATRAKVHTTPANQAAHKTKMARRASDSFTVKAKQATTVSAFVQQARRELQLQLAAIQSQLDLINELSSISDGEKLDLLFTLIDRDCDGTIDSRELAVAMRKRNEDLSFTESLDRAINMVAVFDTDGDARLNIQEFHSFVNTMMEELGVDFHEFSEFLVLQIIFADSGNTPQQEAAAEMIKEDIDEQVKARQALMDVLTDTRMLELFDLFDKDGTRSLNFREVAIGLYQISSNMEESVKTTMNVLLMMDPDDTTRKLNYEQFGRLIMSIVATSETTFDEIADELTLCLTQNTSISEEDFRSLLVAEDVFAEAKGIKVKEEVEEEEKREEKAEEGQNDEEVMDALSYGRLTKLFELWDANDDNTISFQELVRGLRTFQTAAGVQDDDDDAVEEQAITLLGFDQDGDQSLDKKEFATAMVHHAKARHLDLHELIDFMCVTAVLDEEGNAGYQQAYLHSHTEVPKSRVVYPELYAFDDAKDDEDFRY